MALVQALVSVETTDAYGITATTAYFAEVDDTKTVAQMMSDVIALGSAQQGLTQGNVVSSNITVRHDITPAGAALGDVEKGALFNFANGTDPYAQGYWIADVAPAILNAQGLIDLTNANVTAFITFLTTAHTALTIVTKGVRALTALIDALISFRKYRKPLTRRTKEI